MKNQLHSKRAIDLPEHKIAFFAVPKIATTTIKKMFHQIEHRKPYADVATQPNKRGIHEEYKKTLPFLSIAQDRYADFARIAIIRDPVERMLSAYSNRVLVAHESATLMEEKQLRQTLELEARPPLYKFLRQIDEYRLMSPDIRHHTAPMTTFLGSDLGYFTHVFKFEELDKFVDLIAQLTGQEISFPEVSNKSEKRTTKTLGQRARQALLEYCAGDYALVKGYYSIDEYL